MDISLTEIMQLEFAVEQRDKEIERLEAELARLQAGLVAADEIMKRAVEESARLRSENERLTAILQTIDTHAPRADKTCVKPGITLSQAAINMLRDEGHPLFVDAPVQVQEASE